MKQIIKELDNGWVSQQLYAWLTIKYQLNNYLYAYENISGEIIKKIKKHMTFYLKN